MSEHTDIERVVAAVLAHALPREDRGPVLQCIHPDPAQRCDEEAAWFVWYYGSGGIYTYSCHQHLIDRLRDVRYSVKQIRRTPRWEPDE